MAKLKTSWREKLADDKDLPRIEVVTPKMSQKWGKGRFVIPAPRQVDALMRKVRKGRLTTINDIRASLARAHKVNFACPITTGIFATIAARAAGEDEADAKVRVTPYWRTLKEGGFLSDKYPGGPLEQKERLEAEGHTIIPRGKRFSVQDYGKKLMTLP
jgi:hypothetical protein